MSLRTIARLREPQLLRLVRLALRRRIGEPSLVRWVDAQCANGSADDVELAAPRLTRQLGELLSRPSARMPRIESTWPTRFTVA